MYIPRYCVFWRRICAEVSQTINVSYSTAEAKTQRKNKATHTHRTCKLTYACSFSSGKHFLFSADCRDFWTLRFDWTKYFEIYNEDLKTTLANAHKTLHSTPTHTQKSSKIVDVWLEYNWIYSFRAIFGRMFVSFTPNIRNFRSMECNIGAWKQVKQKTQ